ncbi:hypothetical protein XENTR_v10002739 [Xenopus tropicalis]|nr:hypothetical protein XENTR_v10002739 [Xenopus tropicalis]
MRQCSNHFPRLLDGCFQPTPHHLNGQETSPCHVLGKAAADHSHPYNLQTDRCMKLGSLRPQVFKPV